MSLLAGLLRPRILREAVWVAGAHFVAAFARIASVRVLTELLSPATYGTMALLLGLTTLATGVFVQPIQQALLRFHTEAAMGGRLGLLRGLGHRMQWTGVALASVLLLGGGAVWIRRTGSGVSLLAFGLAAAVFATDAVRILESNFLGAARRQKAWGIWTALDAIVRPGVAIAAVLLWAPSVEAVFLGTAIGGLVSLLPLLPLVRRGEGAAGSGGSEAVHTAGTILRYALPLAPVAILMWLVNSGDRYVLGGARGAEAVGEYAAAYGLASMPMIFWSGIGLNTLRPVLFDAVTHGDRRKERATVIAWLTAFFLPSLLGVAIFWAFSTVLVSIALGEAFRGAASILPWIAAAYALQGAQMVFETMLHAQQRTRRLAFLQAAGAAVAVVLYFVLIPRMGGMGAAVATFASFAVSCSLGAMLASAPRLLASTSPAA